MGAKTGTKSGRPLKQNGKNKAQENEENKEGPDYSVLRKPVEISVLGLSEVLKVFQSCTPELRHLLSYECDVIYECKLCRNLFRSLANFISHKRVYCTQLHNNTQINFKNNRRVDDTTILVQPEPVRITRARESCLNSISICDKTQNSKPKQNNGHEESVPFRITARKDLTSIVEKLMQKNAPHGSGDVVGRESSASEFYDGVSKELEERKKEAKEHTVHLEPIDSTSFGVFQTVVHSTVPPNSLIKSQVQDLQKIISNTEVILGPDGKVIESYSMPSSNALSQEERRKKCTSSPEVEYSGPRVTAPESEVELFCNICKEHFSSFKSLNRHMKTLHTVLRTFYPCPCCKVPFSNSWSVYRHLLKVHRKTNEQIRKLRDKVIKRSFKKEILQTGAQKLSKPNTAENPLCPSEVIYDTTPAQVPLSEEENDKWFGHHEDGLDLQCCGGCGRRFERRAALLAHSQSCVKLIAAKQNVTGGSRPSVQADKSAAGARPIQTGKVTSGVLSSVSSVIPTSWPSSIPALPLNHNIHLSQEKDSPPAKKIEIQVRKDYGKSLLSNCEYRTRTSSTSRSEDGAVSAGRSDDGMTSGSSETEASGVSNSHLRTGVKPEMICSKTTEKKMQDDPEGKKRNFPLSDSSSCIKQPEQHYETAPSVIRKSVGRPKKRPDVTHVNGVVSTQNNSNFVEETSDESTDVSKEEPLIQRNCMDSRKRKASSELSMQSKVKDVKEGSFLSKFNAESDNPVLLPKNNEIKTEEVVPSVHKLQCLVCQKKYRSLGNLRRHFATHIGWNRFRCLMCDFRCFSKSDCISHALSEHLDSWEKGKAAALVQDMQMDAGGSIDIQTDSGDSDSMGSVIDVLSGTAEEQNSFEHFEKSDVPDTASPISTLAHEASVIDEIGEIIGVA